MLAFDAQAISVLTKGHIRHMPALPFKVQDHFADMGIMTDIGSIKVIAEGYDLPSGEETFALSLSEFEEATYWPDGDGRSAWPPIQASDRWNAKDLVEDVLLAGQGGLLTAVRSVIVYGDPSVMRADVRKQGDLVLARALTIEDAVSGSRLLIYASPRLACSLEVTCDHQRIEELISEFAINAVLVS